MFDIPESIKSIIGAERYTLDSTGMSGSGVLLFPDKVLKIQAISQESENEIRAMGWLEGRLCAPKVLAHEYLNGKSYLLMSRAPGQIACDPHYMADPGKLTATLAQALQELWQVDISDCPLSWSLDRKLEAARYNVENDLVDTENVEPDTFGKNGFKDPQALLQWLMDNRPAEESALSHGDFCLPNIFIKNGQFTFIDLGRTGIADKWCDIALCYRSLKHNYAGKYGGSRCPEYAPSLLFEKLGMAPDWEKIRYYLLLDELF